MSRSAARPRATPRFHYVLDHRISRSGPSTLTFHDLAPGRHTVEVLAGSGTGARASTTSSSEHPSRPRRRCPRPHRPRWKPPDDAAAAAEHHDARRNRSTRRPKRRPRKPARRKNRAAVSRRGGRRRWRRRQQRRPERRRREPVALARPTTAGADAAKIAAMAYDEDLANRVRELILSEDGVREQRMFGGLRVPDQRQPVSQRSAGAAGCCCASSRTRPSSCWRSRSPIRSRCAAARCRAGCGSTPRASAARPAAARARRSRNRARS